jgi:hypothetical protein
MIARHFQCLLNFRIRKVHFGVRRHEFLQHILFHELVGRRLILRLLRLIEHHFLDCFSRLTIEVREFRIFRLDFCDINLWLSLANLCKIGRIGGVSNA